MRLIVARCEVRYSGRLTAVLPEALRLLMLKSDGSVMVHADTGGYKPQNWMTPPTVIETEGEPLERMVVRKRAGATEDRLDIRIVEVVSDVTHDMGEAAALEKDGVEAHLQELLAERLREDPAMAECQGVLAAQQIKPQARVLAESRGLRCVEVDLAVLRGEREPDLTLFLA